MNSKVIIGIAVLAAALAGTANAEYLTVADGEIIEITADSAWGHTPIVAAGDESGMTGDLHDQPQAGYTPYWQALAAGSDHWWAVEFDQAYELGDAWIWNSRHSLGGTYGFRLTEVFYTSPDGPEIQLDGDPNEPGMDPFEFAIATGSGPIAHQTVIPFGGVLATEVRFKQINDWGAAWGAGGLEEVRFNLYSEVEDLEGDFDFDDDVDGADFLIWQRDDGSAAGLTLWQTNFGKVAPLTAASTAVPEPASLLLFGLGVVSATSYRRQFG